MSQQRLAPIQSGSRAPSIRTNNSGDIEVQSGHAWAKAVADPWHPLILTCDGGGIRGYSSLLILQHLMHQISTWETRLEQEEGHIEGSPRYTFNEDELLPCHYFDYMYGTSTGGLIATMLGRLRMSVPQCLRIYREVGDNLFGHRRSYIPLATKYHSKPLETAVQRIVRQYCKQHAPGECDGHDWHPWKLEEERQTDSPSDQWHFRPRSDDRICQSICLTATHTGRVDEAYLLRTYPHRYDLVPPYITIYNEGADKMRIWQVTRATSAAPFYFKILEADIRGELVGFKDGGIRENNPAGAAWSEYISMYGEDDPPALLLSVGTGKPNESHDGFASTWPGPLGRFKITKTAAEKFAVFKNVLIKYTEGEEKHRSMMRLAKGENKWYKRINVSHGLETMKLDNWEKGLWRDPDTGAETIVNGGKSLRRMEDVTREYLTRESQGLEYAPPKEMLNQIAEKLVRHRRARERTRRQDPRRWETYMGRWLTGELGPEDGPITPVPETRRGSRGSWGRRRS